nr:PLP-dependent transferase [Ensifer sp. Root31]
MKDLTRCVVTPHVNAEGFATFGVGVHRASTIVFDTAEDYANRGQRGPDGYSYGLYGTPTTRTLEAKLTALENGARTFLVPSGQAANAIAMLPFLKAGDGILIADSVYPRCAISPIRNSRASVSRLPTTIPSIHPISSLKSTPEPR